MNGTGDGHAYAVYDVQLTRTDYRGVLIEVMQRPSTVPIQMNFVAVGEAADSAPTASAQEAPPS